jgi:hypothetical protein
VVHSGGGAADLTTKNGKKVLKLIDLGLKISEKYFFRVKQVVAGAFGSVGTVRSFHFVGCDFSLFMSAHLCMHHKGTFFALPHPTMIGPNRLPRQVEAETYPKKNLKNVCNILGHSEGGIFVAQGGLTRMTCGFTPANRPQTARVHSLFIYILT